MNIVLVAQLLQKALGEGDDIVPALPQRRDGDRHNAQPVVQVLAERFIADHFFQITVGGCQYPHIHRDGTIPADAGHRPLLQDAQQLYLHILRQLAHLIQKDRALVRQFKKPRLAVAVCSGKSALFIPEQLAFHQIGRDRPAVDSKEPSIPARAVFINVFCHLFLADTGLAQQQHGGIPDRHPPYQIQHLQHPGIHRQKVGGIQHLISGKLNFRIELFAQLLFLLVLLLQMIQIGHIAHIGDHHYNIAQIIKHRSRRDQRPSSGTELLLHCDGAALRQRDKGAGAVDGAGLFQLPHRASQYLLRFHAGDRLVGAVDAQRNGLAVGDIDTVVGILNNGVETVVGFLQAAKEPVRCPVGQFRHSLPPL